MLRDRDGRIFLDVNPACFRAVLDYFKERKIASTDNNPGKPHVGKDDYIVLQQLILAFGLGDDKLVHSMKYDGKPKVKGNRAESDAHSLASQDKWQTMKFNTFP